MVFATSLNVEGEKEAHSASSSHALQEWLVYARELLQKLYLDTLRTPLYFSLVTQRPSWMLHICKNSLRNVFKVQELDFSGTPAHLSVRRIN